MSTYNPLTDLLTPQVRKYLYALYLLAGLVVGALAVAGVDVHKAPDVLAYLAIPFGALAASNIQPSGVDDAGTILDTEDDLTYEQAGGATYPEGEDDYAGEPGDSFADPLAGPETPPQRF